MIKAAILTISDSCAEGKRQDKSGTGLNELLVEFGLEVVKYDIIKDDKDFIRERLIYYSDLLKVNLVLTCGGTGLSPSDVTPEATREVIGKEISGISELIRTEGAKKTKYASLSRAICGLRGRTLIINLPGSVNGAKDSLKAVIDILPHAFDMIAGKGH